MIDEVDSILIDEARTPLIISGLAEKPSDRYYKAAKIAEAFERDIHYTVSNELVLSLQNNSLWIFDLLWVDYTIKYAIRVNVFWPPTFLKVLVTHLLR